ncbi:MAG: hypothetical protein WDW38_004917 [Sanguina aurantia]
MATMQAPHPALSIIGAAGNAAAAKAARGGSNDKSNSKRYSQRGGSGSGAANDPQGSAKPRAKKAGDQKALPTRTAAGQSKVAKMKQGKRVGGKKI